MKSLCLLLFYSHCTFEVLWYLTFTIMKNKQNLTRLTVYHHAEKDLSTDIRRASLCILLSVASPLRPPHPTKSEHALCLSLVDFFKGHVSFMKAFLSRGAGLEQEATFFLSKMPQLLESILDSLWVWLAIVLHFFPYLKLLSSDLMTALWKGSGLLVSSPSPSSPSPSSSSSSPSLI